MFTGIIEQTGTLVSLTDRGGVRRITVEAPGIANRLREGDSLAVSGVSSPRSTSTQPTSTQTLPRKHSTALPSARSNPAQR